VALIADSGCHSMPKTPIGSCNGIQPGK
jgi:hypothetical protein